MKKLLSLALALLLVFTLAACGGSGGGQSTQAPTDSPETEEPSGGGDSPSEGEENDNQSDEPFPGKLAIITNTVSQNEEEYRSAQEVVEKYGADKVTHVTWPDNFMTEQEQMVSIVARLAGDPEVKAIVINQAVPGSNAAIDKLLETRDDMFIVYCTPQENPPDVVQRADLTLIPDEIAMGPRMAAQAHAMGAETFIHYSFQRHMSQVLISGRHALLKAECEKLGIAFYDVTAPDPTSDVGIPGAQQFILEDVPKQIELYGPNTAFFSTNCSMQVPLITAVVAEGAIYPQPCCPSPYHGFPTALGIETPEEGLADIEYIKSETARILKEKGVEGRLSTWPVPVAMMNTVAGAEYAVKWMNGDVPADTIDRDVLLQCMKDYAGVEVTVAPYTEDGTEYPTFLMCIMDYLTY